MKLIYKSEKYRIYNERHARRLNERRLNFLYNKKIRNRSRNWNSTYTNKNDQSEKRPINKKKYKNIIAPSNFSLINNIDDMIIFIDKLIAQLKKKEETWVGLKNLTHLTNDAIIVLLSIMIDFRSNHVEFNGDIPANRSIEKILRNSGFFERLYMQDSRYTIDRKPFGICTHAWKKVDSLLGKEVIEAASKTVWGEPRRCQGLQRTLIELMQNTNNHAAIDEEGQKHWWLSVNHLKEENRVCFSFVDYGIGVFHSLDNKKADSKFWGWRDKIEKKYSYKNNAELLRLILEGKLHQTVTNNHFRGKGLPGIKEALDRNSISKLTIITNNVFAKISENEYQTINKNFPGTFIYWELNQTNRSTACLKKN